MEELFIEKITINEVRHLKDVEIAISDKERKHLILTGKNGSGKTSLLESVKNYFAIFEEVYTKDAIQLKNDIINTEKEINVFTGNSNEKNIQLLKEKLRDFEETYKSSIKSVSVGLNSEYLTNIYKKKTDNEFVLCFFSAKRDSKLDVPMGIKKINLKKSFKINKPIFHNFLQYIVNLKADRSFANDDDEINTVVEIDNWFETFKISLEYIFDDSNLELVFNRKDYNFNIVLENGQVMPFNALSDGYSAILNIVMELMLRMEGKVKNVYDIQGIVLIDEIETHLHIDLQKKILPFLTSFFPKIQFIVSTHSPFVISSLENAVVYDLENHTRFEDLSDYPIDGIVEGYFDNDKYSSLVTQKIKEYELLTEKTKLTKVEEKRRYELFQQLNDVSGKLAPELKLKFQQIQLKRLAKANG